MCVGHSPPITATSVSFGEMHFAMMWFNLCLHLVPFDELFFFTWQDTSLRSHTHLLLFQSAQNVSGVCWQCEGYLTSVITMTALWLGPFTRARAHTHTHTTHTHTPHTHTHTHAHTTHTHILCQHANPFRWMGQWCYGTSENPNSCTSLPPLNTHPQSHEWPHSPQVMRPFDLIMHT